MTQEFVSYEQALALKELGFDERCFGFYDGGDKSLTDTSCRNSEDWLYKNSCTAPLKQQVFRWFRDTHKMYHDVTYRSMSDKWEYSIGREWVGFECGGDRPYKTYEEAENACIDKLIEIVKNK